MTSKPEQESTMSQSPSSSVPVPSAASADAERKNRSRLLALAGASGVLASVCCVGPLIAVSLGLGGAVAGTMVAFAPYRPIFIALAIGALGYAGWSLYRKPVRACAPGEPCALPAAKRLHRIVFWFVAAVVVALLVAPVYAPVLLKGDPCGSCQLCSL